MLDKEYVSHMSRLIALIGKVSSVPIDADAIKPETHLSEDLALDSISQVALIALAEESFGISLSEHPDEVARIQTVGDAVNAIAAHMTRV